jgi:DNA polymerase-3 subunit chi
MEEVPARLAAAVQRRKARTLPRDQAGGFARVFYLFDEAGIAAARTCWRELRRGSAERHYWKQQGGRWLEGP